MAYDILKKPPLWISAHADNFFTIKAPTTIAMAGLNNGGYLRLLLSGAFPYPISVGDKIYISTGTDYTGVHVIKSIASTVDFTLETLYTTYFIGSIEVKQFKLPEIKIYKGYNIGEWILTHDTGTFDMYLANPYTLVGSFMPSINYIGNIEVNIKKYSALSIEAPYKSAYSYDETSYYFPDGSKILLPKISNRIQVVLDGTLISTHYVCNAAIPTADLTRYYTDTGRSLQPLKQPVKYFGEFTNGQYINDILLTEKNN